MPGRQVGANYRLTLVSIKWLWILSAALFTPLAVNVNHELLRAGLAWQFKFWWAVASLQVPAISTASVLGLWQ